MASVRTHSDDDRIDQSPDPASDSVQSQLTIHSVPYTGLPMHMYPFAPGVVSTSQPQIRSKRRQVKNACTNCQKACKKCDDARPCLRCVKYGIGEECVDSQRKERKKGIKRGPYKKRDGKSELSLGISIRNLLTFASNWSRNLCRRHSTRSCPSASDGHGSSWCAHREWHTSGSLVHGADRISVADLWAVSSYSSCAQAR